MSDTTKKPEATEEVTKSVAETSNTKDTEATPRVQEEKATRPRSRDRG